MVRRLPCCRPNRRSYASRMLRSSILFVMVSGCGGTVAVAPTDGGVDSADPIDTALADTGTSPPIDTSVLSPPDMGPPPTPGATPPPRPTVMVAGGVTKWFAIRKLQLGVTNRVTGASDANAWKQYGFDLDGRTTTAEDSKISNNSCRRVPGSPTKVLTDGELGRDNNFGQHFMAVVKSLKADAEDSVTELIRSGRATLLLRLDNVGPTDNASVPGSLFLAGGLGGTPREDGTDKWPIDASSIDSAKEARAKFPKGYMAGGVWVSGELGTTSATIPLPSFGATWMIPMESVVISFDVATGSMGTIAGATQSTKFVEAITPMMKQWGICPGNATFDQIAATVMQSSDLVSGAKSLQDTTRECNALSIGIGFLAVPAAPSTSYVTAPGFPDMCGP